MIGKRIKVAYNDGKGVAVRQGKLASFENGLICIEQAPPYPVLLIGVGAVVRIEVLG